MTPVVADENQVYEYIPPENGAGPMWAHGNTCIVRAGSQVFASGLETLPEESSLNNVVPLLFRLHKGHWELVYKGQNNERTREPSPLGVFPDGRLWLSVNPTLTPPGTDKGPAAPHLLEFSVDKPHLKPQAHWPHWSGTPSFTEHSYRSLAVDGPNREMIIFQNQGYTHSSWAFCDQQGKWSAQGELKWPFGHEYDKPQPIRICYPRIQISNRAVHFFGVSDIIEPYQDWREFKKKLTGRDWDYDFRRLFYTWSDDICRQDFKPWIEIASRDLTCGWINPGDFYLDPQGTAHFLWSERAIDERLRREFFPAEKQSMTLHYAQVRDGKIKQRRKIIQWQENLGGDRPGWARFQVTPSGRLFIFYSTIPKDGGNTPKTENRIVEISSEGCLSEHLKIPFQNNFTSFYTATVRSGSPPANKLDILGQTQTNVIGYAQVELE